MSEGVENIKVVNKREGNRNKRGGRVYAFGPKFNA